MMAGTLSSGAWANDVYVEQIGDNSTVSITQTGAGNLVNGNVDGTGNTDDAAIIRGDLNDVTINQIGASNTVKMIINNESNGTGSTVVIVLMRLYKLGMFQIFKIYHTCLQDVQTLQKI